MGTKDPESQRFVVSPDLKRRLDEKASAAGHKLEAVVAAALERVAGEAPDEVKGLVDAQQSGGGKGGVIVEGNIAPRTPEWAGIVRPLAWFIFILAASVLLLPFFVIAATQGLTPEGRIEQLLNWGTHVLAVVVGLASAVVGYFFGQAHNGGAAS